MPMHGPFWRMATAGGLVALSVSWISGPAADAQTTTSLPNSTSANVLTGAGGQFSLQLVNQLLNSSDLNLGGDSATFQESLGMDAGREAFATGSADFAVAESALTGPNPSDPKLFTDEAGTAAGYGRAFAYVPFAAQAVALGAVVNPTNCGNTVSTCATYTNIEMSVPTLEQVMTDSVTSWEDPSITTTTGAPLQTEVPSQINDKLPSLPSIDTADIVSLILSNPTARAAWDSYVVGPTFQSTPDTVFYTWPNLIDTVSTQDQDVEQKLVPPEPGDPGVATSNPNNFGVGDIGALGYSWTLPNNIPTVAVQNADGAYVHPSAASEAAAFSHATMDPTTNLVTFDADAAYKTDPAEYPMMAMSYLVVPLNGLSADKATALSNLIKFALSSEGQNDAAKLGFQPISSNPAMMAAGENVADEVAAEATTASTTTTTTTTTTVPATTTPNTTSSSTSTTTPASTTGTSGGGATFSSSGLVAASDNASGVDQASGSVLATTGSDSRLMISVGLALVGSGEAVRRLLRARRRNRAGRQ